MSGKLFAVVVILIALASAVPIVTHTFMGATVAPPQDISTHGAEIDKQMDETMIEAGLSFLAAQIVLGIFVWGSAGAKGEAEKLSGRSQVSDPRRGLACRRGSDRSGRHWKQGLGKSLLPACLRGRSTDSSASGTIRLLLPLCRP